MDTHNIFIDWIKICIFITLCIYIHIYSLAPLPRIRLNLGMTIAVSQQLAAVIDDVIVQLSRQFGNH